MDKVIRRLTFNYLLSGINLAFAALLLENGCNVVIADLGLRPEAQAVVNKFNGRSGTARAVFQKTDVTDWVQLEELFKVAEREFTEIDIVCPGAGVYEEVCIHTYLRIRNLLMESSTGAISGGLPALQKAAMTPEEDDIVCLIST